MNQNNTKNKPNIQMQNSNMEEIPSIVYGLSVNGIVIDRMRRLVPKDNPTTEIVTYTILDRNNRKQANGASPHRTLCRIPKGQGRTPERYGLSGYVRVHSGCTSTYRQFRQS